MSLAELQTLVDELASRVDAPTLLESAEQRMIAYSAHQQALDDSRQTSILRREVPQALRQYTRAAGVYHAVEPVRLRVPPDIAPGHLGRLAVPARHHGRLLGMLWLIDDQERLGEREIEAAVGAARHASFLLHEEDLRQRLGSELLAHLLSPVDELRLAAVEQLEHDGFAATAPVHVAVVRPATPLDDDVTHALVDGLNDARIRLASRALRSLAREDHVVLLLRGAPGTRAADDAVELVRASVAVALPEGARQPRILAGIGERQESLGDARTSYQQALLSVRVAAAVPSVGDVCLSGALGPFRTLGRLGGTRPDAEALDPRLLALLGPERRGLLQTLETYLDLAGDAKRAAALLNLHRATLYYRLERVSEITGADLRDGLDRLSLHLGIKLARLWGIEPLHRHAEHHPGGPVNGARCELPR